MRTNEEELEKCGIIDCEGGAFSYQLGIPALGHMGGKGGN